MIHVVLLLLLMILYNSGCVQSTVICENTILAGDSSHINREFQITWKDDPVVNTSRIHSRKRKNLKNFAK